MVENKYNGHYKKLGKIQYRENIQLAIIVYVYIKYLYLT